MAVSLLCAMASIIQEMSAGLEEEEVVSCRWAMMASASDSSRPGRHMMTCLGASLMLILAGEAPPGMLAVSWAMTLERSAVVICMAMAQSKTLRKIRTR